MLLKYMKEQDIATGEFAPRSEIFSFYHGDTDFIYYAWLPEVSCMKQW